VKGCKARRSAGMEGLSYALKRMRWYSQIVLVLYYWAVSDGEVEELVEGRLFWGRGWYCEKGEVCFGGVVPK
jgi:hypothetical protein